MKLRLLSVLLIFCMLLTAAPVFGAAAGGSAGAASGTKPFYPNYDDISDEGYYYGHFDYEYVEDYGDRILFGICHENPNGGGTTHNLDLYPFAKINGKTYSSTAAMMQVLPTSSVPIEIKMEWIETDDYWGNAITELNFDTTATTYYGKAYSPATGTFQGLSATAGLPVYYCMVDEWDGEVWYEWYWPYLDGIHTYDIDVYDYGVVIKNIWANGYPISFYYIRTESKPNGKMLSNVQATAWEMWENNAELTGIQGELYDAKGVKLQTKTGTYIDYEWAVTFTDLPAEKDSYSVKLWGLSGNSVVTPIYSYDYEKPTTYFEEGTVVAITDESYSNDYQAAEVEFMLDSSGRMRHFYCRLPVEVGDKVCNTVAELRAVLPVGSFAKCAESDHNYAFQLGVAETVYDNYGAISEFKLSYDGEEDVVMLRLMLPDGTLGEYKIYSGAKMGDERLDDINEVYDYVKRNNGMPATFQEEDGVITHFTVGEGSTNYSRQTYSEYSEAFSDLSKKENKLPVYYTYNGSFYPTYLDSEHYYDLVVYQYGAVITDMYAKYMQETVKTLTPGSSGNRNLLLELGFVCEATGGEVLAGQLYDAHGRKIAEASAPISGTECEVVFTDLPNTDAKYRYLLWVEDRYGSMVSPYYEKDITVEKLPAGTGTVEAVQVIPGDWNNEDSVFVKIKTTGGESLAPETAARFYVDGERYRDGNEMAALLQAGTKIEYILDADGKLTAVKRTNQPSLSYGSIVEYKQMGGGAEISIFTSDGIVKHYTMDEYGWLNGHFMGSFDNLSTTLGSANSWYVAYVADGDKLTTLKTGKNSTNYAGLTYSGRKFSSLPDSSKNLPVYYSVAGMAADPILNENHLYDVILYDYAIEIIDMKAKGMDATICYMEVSSQLNSKFFQDIKVEVLPYVDADGTVVKAQLLDSKGYLLEEVSQATNAYDFMGITFPNRPNQDGDCRVKVWVEDASGNRISPHYTKTLSITELDITYGTVESTQVSVDQYGDPCVVLEISIPGLSEPVYVTCPLGTVVNGTEIWDEDDLQAAVPVGTTIKVAGDGVGAAQIQTVTTAQAISKPVLSGTTVSAGITTVNNSGKTLTGTAYVSVYNKDHLLKKLTTQPFTIEVGKPSEPVPVEVEGITYQEGDYLKVVCMDENGVPMCDLMKVDI